MRHVIPRGRIHVFCLVSENYQFSTKARYVNCVHLPSVRLPTRRLAPLRRSRETTVGASAMQCATTEYVNKEHRFKRALPSHPLKSALLYHKSFC